MACPLPLKKGGLRRVPLAARQKSFYPWLRDESMEVCGTTTTGVGLWSAMRSQSATEWTPADL